MAEFVGRSAELQALRGRLDDAAVTIVLGRAGIGKTATVRQALRRRAAIEIGVRPGDDLRQTLLAVGRALADKVVIPTTLGDVAALADAIVRAAEHVEATIVVDDVHHLAEADARALLERTLDLARRSRWILVARKLPRGRWKKHAIELDDLDARALARLVRSIAPDVKRAEMTAIVEAAQGSPWLLLRSLGTRGEAPPAPDEIAAALPPRAAPLLRLLAALHLPIDAATARAVLGGQIPRGPEVVRGGDRVRAHDAFRDALAEVPVEPDLPRRLDAAAIEAHDAHAAIEAARLHLERDDVAAAAAIFERIFDDAVDAGLAPRLHQLLRDRTHSRLSELRLRAAVALGAGPSLDEILADPRPQTPAAHVRSAEALLLAGRPTEAFAAIEGRETSPGALLIRARVLLTLGALDEAQSALEAMGDAEDARVMAFTARVAAARGDLRGALSLADALGARADLPSHVRREVNLARLIVYSNAGRLNQVAALAKAIFAAPAAGASFADQLAALGSLSLVEIEGGNVVEGRRLLDLLAPHAERAPAVRFFRRMNAVRLHTIEGDLAAAARETDAVLAEARVAHNRDHERWGLVARSMLRLLRADDVAEPRALLGEDASGSDAQGEFLRAFLRARALRVGVSVPQGSQPSAEVGHAIDARVYAVLADATDAFVRASWDEAEEHARRAIALGEENRYVAHALEARLLLFDVLFVAGKHGAAAATAQEIATMARSCGSRRFALEAELMHALANEHPPVRALERIARSEGVAPSAARRARALLGLEGRCDRVDDRVVRATRWYGAIRSVRGGAEPSWGIDVRSGRIWFPDGRARPFASRALHGALARALADAGGACSKEQLARAVWSVRDYHPLRDDKRIQVAVMRFRRAIEDGKRPRRLLSTADGYAFGEAEPMRLVER